MRKTWIGLVSLAALIVSGVTFTSLSTTAQGTTRNTEGPLIINGKPVNDCSMKTVNGAMQPILKGGCTVPPPLAFWAPPVGAVGPGGKVVTTQIDGPDSGLGFGDFTFHGRLLDNTTVDFLRVPSGPMQGRVRLFNHDIPAPGSGPGNEISPAARAASAALGTQPIPMMIEVTPAPLSSSLYPLKAGDNSIGL
jgi:hypothetical protein